MSQDNVIEDVVSDVSRAFAKVINASSEFAVAMIELRIQRLREAARRDEEQARAAREQTRMHHQADSAVWRAAMRPQWWRDAGAEDIGRVWRAASMWQDVDPRAAEARQVVVDRLADRGVHVDAGAPGQPGPDDVAWLSDALDRAAADRAAGAAAGDAERGRARPGRDQSATPGGGPTVIDGEASEAPAAGQPRRSAQEREDRATEHVRAAWSPERAERVIGCKAWGALVTQLDQLEEHGHDVEALLRGVPAFVDQAHTPAAFAFRSIDDRLDGLVDLGTQRRGDVAEQGSEARSGADGSLAGEAKSAGDQATATAAVRAVDRVKQRLQEQKAVGDVPAAQGQQGEAGSAGKAEAGESQAAKVAAQAYPITTKEAVAGAAEKAQTGAAGAGTGGPAGTRSTASRPAPQQNRDEPKGR